MYEIESDSYCYPGSDVLKNKAGITDSDALEEFETAMTFARASEPFPRGHFTSSHYRAVHRHLFQDVYTWAGKFRTVRIAKDDSVFCYPEYIDQEMKALFDWLKKQHFLKNRTEVLFAEGAAHFLSRLNAIHAFREGNGRTQLAFLGLLSEHTGHPLNFEKLNPADTLGAMIKAFRGDEEPLAVLLKKLTSTV